MVVVEPAATHQCMVGEEQAARDRRRGGAAPSLPGVPFAKRRHGRFGLPAARCEVAAGRIVLDEDARAVLRDVEGERAVLDGRRAVVGEEAGGGDLRLAVEEAAPRDRRGTVDEAEDARPESTDVVDEGAVRDRGGRLEQEHPPAGDRGFRRRPFGGEAVPEDEIDEDGARSLALPARRDAVDATAVEDRGGESVAVGGAAKGDRLAERVDRRALEVGLRGELDDVAVLGRRDRRVDRGEGAAARADRDRVRGGRCRDEPGDGGGDGRSEREESAGGSDGGHGGSIGTDAIHVRVFERPRSPSCFRRHPIGRRRPEATDR